MSVSFIQEQTEPQLLQEASQIFNEGGSLKVGGIAKLQSFNTLNQNKRVYSTEIGQKFLEEANKKINDPSTSFLGEWDHPSVAGLPNAEAVKRQMSILWERASHQFTRVWMESNIMYGDVKTLSTEKGITMARVILEDHIPVAFSARAMGKTRPAPRYGKGAVEVYGPILLCGYDCVQNPSHKGSIITEVTNIVRDGKKLKMVAEANDNSMLSEAFNDLVLYNELFLSESNSFDFLVENFIKTDNYKNVMVNEDSESKLIDGTMHSILSEACSSMPDDVVDGTSDIALFNESNVNEFLTDFCNYKDNYLTVNGLRNQVKKILGY